MEHLDKGNLVRSTLLRLSYPIRYEQCLPRLAKATLKFAVLFAFILGARSFTVAQLQHSQANIQVSKPDIVRITIRARQPHRDWSFINSYGTTLGLGERVQDFRSGDTDPVAIKKISSGVFQADRPVDAVTYEIHLAIDSAANPAQVSWLTVQGGVLMMADLLPVDVQNDGPIDLRFDLPDQWQLPEFMGPSKAFDSVINDPTNAVITVGPSIRTASKKLDGVQLDVALSGDWPFREPKLIEAATQVLKQYLKLTGFRLPRVRILVAPLPKQGSDTWQAQTRGSTVLLLINPAANFKTWIGQLKVIFTHELLHLWVPNSLSLKRDYDWFFEGFTLYQALVTAVDLKVISFDEYLNTLARVYDSYRSQPDTLSLIEASERRWTGASSAVYDKAMLVAFLYDLLVRTESAGKTKLSDRYGSLFNIYASKTVDANEAIMSVLGFSPATRELLKSYVEGHQTLRLDQTLGQYGFFLQREGGLTDLKIANHPTTDQMRLLRSLGYRR